MYKFLVRLHCERDLFYRTTSLSGGKPYSVSIRINRNEVEVRASSYHEAYLRALDRTVRGRLCVENVPIADSESHYRSVSGYYSTIDPREIAKSVDVYIPHRGWIPVSSLPPGNIYERSKSQTKGTRAYLQRKRRATQERRDARAYTFQIRFFGSG